MTDIRYKQADSTQNKNKLIKKQKKTNKQILLTFNKCV